MKNLKLKLMSAIAMLMVATIGLASVSFAWFTISTNPEVSQMKMNVAANENLEIALDNGYADAAAVDNASANDKAGGVQGSTAGNPYTWGNLINMDYGFYTAQLASVKTVKDSLNLNPVKYDAGGLKYPTYADDGRIAGELVSLTSTNVKAYSPLADADLKGGLKVYSQGILGQNNVTNLDAFSATYWLRSNMGTTVSLSEAGVQRAKSTPGGTAVDDVYEDLDGDVNLVTGSGSYVELSGDADTNAKLLDWLKTGKLVIQFDVAGTSVASYYAYPGEASESKYTLKLSSTLGSYTAATIALNANEAKKVTMYVYLNGEKITNADAFLVDVSGIGLNIQFTGTNVDDAMDAGATAVTEPDNYMHSGN